ncbi:hypothetical protein HPB48_008465 [Haemaphysalis longicornis]|uniref:Ig-like domain-containing protein n=1 Tax=Haemaphysalis longicornis TaxID=44386 RepID=A0A9J6FPU8_HAELO|nr:hypothetical protein HPB48_008465 [Haemaphysalis longicornis]
MPNKVIVHCAVLEGAEPLTFVWLKNGARIAPSQKVTLKHHSESSSLAIANVGAEDIGNYSCTATNAAGSDTVVSQLLVTGEPLSFLLRR